MSEVESENWEHILLNEAEQLLAKIASWGPAEDWADWLDLTGGA
jgi:hypothetical protein